MLGIPLLENKKGFFVSCFFGLLVAGFLVSWFLGFRDSWFLGFKDSWSLGFRDSRNPLMFFKNIGTILQNFNFMLSGKY